MELSNDVRQLVDKAKENGSTVLGVGLNGTDFVYRSINRLEWRELQRGIQSRAKAAEAQDVTIKDEGEDDVVMKALISPKLQSKQELLQLPAGVVTQLADLILRASGFTIAEDAAPVKL